MTHAYEKETRRAYRNTKKARHYHQQQTEGLSWARFTSWRKKTLVHRALGACHLTGAERMLDIPCGSGILGSIFQKEPAILVASDISREMIQLARNRYQTPHFLGFLQADITRAPFPPGSFACILVIGLMHRLSESIRQTVLRELATLSSKYIIMSYAYENNGQKFKRWLLKRLKRSHKPAPSPASLSAIQQEFRTCGLRVLDTYYVMPFFSAQMFFLLEKV